MWATKIGMKVTAVAVVAVGTAGVAAATTAGPVLRAASVDAPATTIPEVVVDTTLPDAEVTVPAETPTTEAPETPTSAPPTTIPSVPLPPGLPSVPVEPVADAVEDVVALLPTPQELATVVRGCVTDLAALAPTPTPTASGGPLGILGGLLGALGGGQAPTPKLPDPKVVQSTVTACIEDVLGVLPSPTELAAALTGAFDGQLPAPVQALVAQLTGKAASLPDAGGLLDLVSGLAGATGSPASLVDQLADVLDGIVPAPLDQLVSFPFTVIHQVFAGVGLA